ncbi:Acetyltransferase (GNAT) family protein [Planctomycetes bacterium Pla86]|uniref:Acetyltransferase (GNAT) family protein n=1 Tax=Engelhardtia mirabilis TaxID=2528011 RepID=A0A518BF74_9BACT|nr:Acetyltransferase (GNAT) family protein [Planctomycetes bacterium Pla133]QDU99963.1 Acetyltransferase (GNAT) family protein [Planctomycetes bacterium Pla86]
MRETLEPGDDERVRDIVRSTAFFSPEEEDIAVELVQETLARGDASGYRFQFLSVGEACVAYTCFGRIPGTQSSFDLYWIATHEGWRGRGLGRRLLSSTEARIRALGGDRVYVDTSSRAQYEPTRRFYERCDYRKAAQLDDFYGPGDGKVIYCRALGDGPASNREAASLGPTGAPSTPR